VSIDLPVSQTLGRDLDCHASTTKEGKDKRIKVLEYTECIVKNRLKTEQVSRERRVQSGLQPVYLHLSSNVFMN